MILSVAPIVHLNTSIRRNEKIRSFELFGGKIDEERILDDSLSVRERVPIR